MRRGAARAAVIWSAVALMCLGAVGCSAEQEKDDAPTPSASPTPDVEPAAETVVRQGVVQGFLTETQRQQVTDEVAEAVDGWLETAWVGGSWPRTMGESTWDAFTEGAAQKARADLQLTSGAHYAERVSAVRATRRDLTVDLLAQQGTAHGGTVRVTLNLTVTPTDAGLAEQKVVLRGRVFVTPTDTGWKIFGYDLARGGW